MTNIKLLMNTLHLQRLDSRKSQPVFMTQTLKCQASRTYYLSVIA